MEYFEIEPYTKKDELLEILKDYDVEVFTSEDEGFEYLENLDCVLVVNNPNHSTKLYIELAGEFSMFFGDWHTHYYPDNEIYEYLKRDLEGILKGELVSFVAYNKNGWLGSNLCEYVDIKGMETKKIINTYCKDNHVRQNLIHSEGWIELTRWQDKVKSILD